MKGKGEAIWVICFNISDDKAAQFTRYMNVVLQVPTIDPRRYAPTTANTFQELNLILLLQNSNKFEYRCPNR
jgi:hypothetical protein